MLLAVVANACDDNQKMCEEASDCLVFCAAYENSTENVQCVKNSCVCKGTQPEPTDGLCEQDAECTALCSAQLQSEKAVCQTKNCYCQYTAVTVTCEQDIECAALCKTQTTTKESACIQKQCYCKYVQSEK